MVDIRTSDATTNRKIREAEAAAIGKSLANYDKLWVGARVYDVRNYPKRGIIHRKTVQTLAGIPIPEYAGEGPSGLRSIDSLHVSGQGTFFVNIYDIDSSIHYTHIDVSDLSDNTLDWIISIGKQLKLQTAITRGA